MDTTLKILQQYHPSINCDNMVFKHIPVTVLCFFMVFSYSQQCGVSITAKEVQLKSKNFPTRYLRHRDNEIWLDEYSTDALYQGDSTFTIVAGLAGEGVSLRSKNLPTYYIRHRDFDCFLQQDDGSAGFRRDATFIQRLGLADAVNGVTFEASNPHGYYLRHLNNQFELGRNDVSETFKNDATFYPIVQS